MKQPKAQTLAVSLFSPSSFDSLRKSGRLFPLSCFGKLPLLLSFLLFQFCWAFPLHAGTTPLEEAFFVQTLSGKPSLAVTPGGAVARPEPAEGLAIAPGPRANLNRFSEDSAERERGSEPRKEPGVAGATGACEGKCENLEHLRGEAVGFEVPDITAAAMASGTVNRVGLYDEPVNQGNPGTLNFYDFTLDGIIRSRECWCGTSGY